MEDVTPESKMLEDKINKTLIDLNNRLDEAKAFGCAWVASAQEKFNKGLNKILEDRFDAWVKAGAQGELVLPTDFHVVDMSDGVVAQLAAAFAECEKPEDLRDALQQPAMVDDVQVKPQSSRQRVKNAPLEQYAADLEAASVAHDADPCSATKRALKQARARLAWKQRHMEKNRGNKS